MKMQETFFRSQNANAGKEPGDLPGLTLYPPSQGGARLSALAKALPLGAPMPAILPAIADAAGLAIADAAGMPALADAAANVMPVIAGAEATAASGAVDPGAVASVAKQAPSNLAALTAKIFQARTNMKDDRAKALWACMYL